MRPGLGECQATEQHRGDDGHCIGFEQIRGHACAVADIVADVVGNHRRVARVVLGNAGFDLADKIGAHIRAFGENTATQAREDRDQRRPERQPDQRMQVLLQRQAHRLQRRKVAGHPKQPEADHQHAGDRPATKRNIHRLTNPMPRRFGGTDIGAHRHVHADIAG